MEFCHLILCLLILFVTSISCRLDERLSNYEVVRFDSQRRKRSSDIFERMEFEAFNKKYRAVMNPSIGLLHNELKVLIVGDNMTREQKGIETDNHYHGHLVGEPNSRVVVSRLQSGGYMGSIEREDETIYLEPAYLHDENAHEEDVLVYRSQDVDLAKTLGRYTFDRAARVKKNISLEDVPDGQIVESRLPFNFNLFPPRTVRSTPPTLWENEKLNRCPLKIVADYKFFTIVGKKKPALTTRYIVNTIARVNEFFHRVDWDAESIQRGAVPDNVKEERGRFVNMGFTIKELKILEQPSDILDHYNAVDPFNKRQWNSDALLKAFTVREGSPDFCLVHLMTAQSFDEEAVIGLAYLAENDKNYVGGICSKTVADNSRAASVTYNTVFTSFVGNTGNKDDYPLVTREAEIVVAHEYGHSWGAPHDTPELSSTNGDNCVPEYKDGGFYIMHSYAQSGYDINNNMFSPCSQRSIRKILNVRYSGCFEKEKISLCGNGILEEDEQCDEGALLPEHHASGSCCTRECRLVPTAVCSPANQPCCSSKCSFHNSSHICSTSHHWQCKAPAFCTGTSGECPSAPPVEDGTPCVEEGECIDGVCRPYCERRDIAKKSCICEKVELSCHRCCRGLNETSACEPQLGAADLPDGTWCVQGHCKNSKCVTLVADYVTSYLNVFNDRSKLWPAIKSNIVGIVVILSVIPWVLGSMYFSKKDKRDRERPRWDRNMMTVHVPNIQ